MARPRTAAGRARTANARLAAAYPGTAEELCALDHDGPFQLLAATILSAQSTDERVNMTTPELFARYPDASAMAEADLAEVETLVRSTGFFRSKAANLVGMAGALVDRFGGEVPTAMADLVSLPGVGRKTANVVRSVAFGLPGLPVDTHVQRLSRRLALTDETDPVKVELTLNPMIPATERGAFSLRLILHGRAICQARRPRCGSCILSDFCPSATERMLPNGEAHPGGCIQPNGTAGPPGRAGSPDGVRPPGGAKPTTTPSRPGLHRGSNPAS
jgi:endonuclease-3